MIATPSPPMGAGSTGGYQGPWYWVEPLDDRTIAIGEPKYEQQNWSYLFIGDDRALLFDTGSYSADITGIVRACTALPLTALPSHMHFDHLGNVTRLDRVAVGDLDMLRACCDGDQLTPTEDLFLGAWEDRTPPRFTVSDWLAVDGMIDLGGRCLTLLHTPGHSPDSVSLWEPGRQRLFAADLLYPGQLLANIPGASLAAYLATAERLAELCGDAAVICAAHSDLAPHAVPAPPRLGYQALGALVDCLRQIQKAPPALHAGEVRDAPVTDGVSIVYNADALSGFRAD